MQPFEIEGIQLELQSGRPVLAEVVLTGGVVLSQIRIWPGRHGPLVQFPLGNQSRAVLELTPVLRSLVVKALVAHWRAQWPSFRREAA